MSDCVCTKASQIDATAANVEKLLKAVVEGNGCPPLMVRTALNEQLHKESMRRLERIEEAIITLTSMAHKPMDDNKKLLIDLGKGGSIGTIAAIAVLVIKSLFFPDEGGVTLDTMNRMIQRNNVAVTNAVPQRVDGGHQE